VPRKARPALAQRLTAGSCRQDPPLARQRLKLPQRIVSSGLVGHLPDNATEDWIELSSRVVAWRAIGYSASVRLPLVRGRSTQSPPPALVRRQTVRWSMVRETVGRLVLLARHPRGGCTAGGLRYGGAR